MKPVRIGTPVTEEADVLALCAEAVYDQGLTIDSGATINVMGAEWLERHLRSRPQSSRTLVRKLPEVVKIRFGGGEPHDSSQATLLTLPTNNPQFFKAHVVPGNCPALICITSLQKTSAVLDFKARPLTIKGTDRKLSLME